MRLARFLREIDGIVQDGSFSDDSAEDLYWRLDEGVSRLYRLVHDGEGVDDLAIEMAVWLHLYVNAVERERESAGNV